MYTVIAKSDQSPVTAGDYAIQAIISLSLMRIYTKINSVTGTLPVAEPTFNLVAEENAAELRSNDDLASRITSLVNKFIEPVDTGLYSCDEVLNAIDLGSYNGVTPPFWTLDPIDGTHKLSYV